MGSRTNAYKYIRNVTPSASPVPQMRDLRFRPWLVVAAVEIRLQLPPSASPRPIDYYCVRPNRSQASPNPDRPWSMIRTLPPFTATNGCRPAP